jgi:hypothetical protein
LDDKSTARRRGNLLGSGCDQEKPLRLGSWLISVIAAPTFDLYLLSWIAPAAERLLDSSIIAICSYMVRSRKTDQQVVPWAPSSAPRVRADFNF